MECRAAQQQRATRAGLSVRGCRVSEPSVRDRGLRLARRCGVDVCVECIVVLWYCGIWLVDGGEKEDDSVDTRKGCPDDSRGCTAKGKHAR